MCVVQIWKRKYQKIVPRSKILENQKNLKYWKKYNQNLLSRQIFFNTNKDNNFHYLYEVLNGIFIV